MFSSIIISVNVYVPKDRVTNLHQGYGFVEFRSEEDADYVSFVLPLVAYGINAVFSNCGKTILMIVLFSWMI